MEPQHLHLELALKNRAAEWIRLKAPKSTKESANVLLPHLTSQLRNDDDEGDRVLLYDYGALWLDTYFRRVVQRQVLFSADSESVVQSCLSVRL